MKVYAYSREAAKKEQKKGKRVWISVNDVCDGESERERTPIKKYDDLLALVFDDVTPYIVENDMVHPYHREELSKRPPIFFDEEMANKVIDIGLRTLVKRKDLHVHCYAGMSRSVAIIQALNEICNLFLAGDRKTYLENLKRVCRGQSNPFVYNTIMNSFIKNEQGIRDFYALYN